MANYVYDILFKRYATEAAAIAAIGSQRAAMSQDTRRLVYNDGGTMRYYWDASRLADQTTSYGTALIGTPGITGITPDGGSVDAAATLQAMLTGLAGMVAGTANQIPLFTAAKVLGNSILQQTGTTAIQLVSNTNDLVFHQVSNTNSGTGAIAGLILTSNVASPSLYAASSGYTTDTVAASCLNLDVPSALTAFNVFIRGATDIMRIYFGSPAAGTLFHTFSNKGIKLENLSLTTDANGTVAGIDHSLSITKNDANARVFYGHKILATLNAGGSNASTDLIVMDVDTVNTATTGITTSLLRLSYGGSPMFNVQSDGDVNIYGNAIFTDAADGVQYQSGAKDLSGSGTPEAAITAPVGSTFRRSDGGAGTSFYVKESGSGNTGWVAK